MDYGGIKNEPEGEGKGAGHSVALGKKNSFLKPIKTGHPLYRSNISPYLLHAGGLAGLGLQSQGQ